MKTIARTKVAISSQVISVIAFQTSEYAASFGMANAKIPTTRRIDTAIWRTRQSRFFFGGPGSAAEIILASSPLAGKATRPDPHVLPDIDRAPPSARRHVTFAAMLALVCIVSRAMSHERTRRSGELNGIPFRA
ncbi:MAG: hypothetical protein ABJC60_01470 [Actinomycetota bacterium]